MYKKKYKFGDYLEGTSPYFQLGSGLINSIDPGNEFGVKSNFGAGASGALSGAAAGTAIMPGIGTLVGGAIGAVTSIIGNNKAKEEEDRIKKERQQVQMNSIREYSKGVLSTYPSFGIPTAKFGMYLPKYPAGGMLPYPTDGSKVNQLSSDAAVYEGSIHENGGIELDTNQDNEADVEVEDGEVIKDNYVLSDRLKPSPLVLDVIKGFGINIKDNDTYASLAERFAKKKGEYEEKLSSTRIGEAGTAKLMIDQLDSAIDNLFQDQQLQKFKEGINDSDMKYNFGGYITDPPNKGRKKSKQGTKSTPKSSRFSDSQEDEFIKYYETVRATDIPTFVDIEPGDPIFYNKNKFFNFYNKRALDKLKDPNLDKSRFTKEQGQNNVDIIEKDPYNAILLLGGTPDFETYLKARRAFEKSKLPNNELPASGLNKLDGVGGYRYDARGGKGLPARGSITKPRYTFGGYMKQNNFGHRGFILGDSDFVPLRKYAYGDPIPTINTASEDYFGLDELDMRFLRDKNFANFRTPGISSSNIESEKNRSLFSNLGDNIKDNLGDITAGVGFLANQAQINKLETEYTPELTRTPAYNFTSRLPQLNQSTMSAFRTASAGIQGSGAQDNQALKSNMFGKVLESLNKASLEEFAREDAFKSRYNELVGRTNIINTDAINRARFGSMDNRNQRRALTQQNIDSALRSVIGNQVVRDQQDLDIVKAKIELAKAGDRGVDKRFLEKIFSPKERRKYFGNYYP